LVGALLHMMTKCMKSFYISMNHVKYAISHCAILGKQILEDFRENIGTRWRNSRRDSAKTRNPGTCGIVDAYAAGQKGLMIAKNGKSTSCLACDESLEQSINGPCRARWQQDREITSERMYIFPIVIHRGVYFQKRQHPTRSN
jgi:hypothetical protein